MRKLFFALALATAAAQPVAADDAVKHSTTDTKPMSAPQDDHTFAMHMAEHHRHGIAMADHVIAKGASGSVKAIARRIRTQQQKELVTLEAHKPGDRSGHHAAMPPKDPDMERAMKELQGASGAKADALFLQSMIIHHAQALVMSHSSVHHLKDEELRTIAMKGIGNQAREIGDLQKLREGKRAAARRAR